MGLVGLRLAYQNVCSCSMRLFAGVGVIQVLCYVQDSQYRSTSMVV